MSTVDILRQVAEDLVVQLDTEVAGLPHSDRMEAEVNAIIHVVAACERGISDLDAVARKICSEGVDVFIRPPTKSSNQNVVDIDTIRGADLRDPEHHKRITHQQNLLWAEHISICKQCREATDYSARHPRKT